MRRVGKWSLGAPGSPGSATNQGFDMWFGYMDQDHAHYYYPEYLDDSEAKSGRLELPGNSRTKERYSHDLMAKGALDFIHESHDRPFFLYAAFTLAHFSSPSEDTDRLAVPSTDPYTDTPWSEPAKKYASMVTRLDRDIGRITDLVKKLGIAENTLIIFTSDNGPWEGLTKEFNSSGPLRGGKRTLYEGGIRVPLHRLLARKKSAKTTSARRSSLSGTYCRRWRKSPAQKLLIELTVSLYCQLYWEKKQLSHHEYLYWDYGHNRAAYHQAVRVKHWKGVRKGLDQEIELYDLDNDNGETQNLAEAHPNVVSKVASIMKEAVVPSERYPIGERYQGKPIWKASDHW